jgi:hypothetical protein
MLNISIAVMADFYLVQHDVMFRLQPKSTLALSDWNTLIGDSFHVFQNVALGIYQPCFSQKGKKCGPKLQYLHVVGNNVS